jgi:hypothetical protein
VEKSCHCRELRAQAVQPRSPSRSTDMTISNVEALGNTDYS